MAGRSLHKLSDAKVKASKQVGRISDGGGLYLNIKGPNAKSWLYIWKRNGNRASIGLGPYPAVSLASAREKAAECRVWIADGKDPRTESKRDAVPTFKNCVGLFLDAMETEWSNEKHRYQWRQTLGTSYCSKIENRLVSEITMFDVLTVLKPIWNSKTETASRLRGRIERVLNFAKVQGWRDGENPAMWRGNLENVLPKPRKLKNGHLPAMPYSEVPAFLMRLQEMDALAARALEMTILTCGRTNEVLKAKWEEIDFDADTWTVPAERMKTRKVHIVPLTKAAIDVLKPLYEIRISDWVFPGQKPNKPLSNMAMEMLLRRMKVVDATVHGFRSSFRDWAGDETTFPREIAEGCLSHVIGNAVEQAYRRSSALEKRRVLLDAWSAFCADIGDKKVVELYGKR